jgi:hypothetical protein
MDAKPGLEKMLGAWKEDDCGPRTSESNIIYLFVNVPVAFLSSKRHKRLKTNLNLTSSYLCSKE